MTATSNSRSKGNRVIVTIKGASKPAAFSPNPIASEPPASRPVPLPYLGAYPVTIEAVGGV